jgi:hypothetical protein
MDEDDKVAQIVEARLRTAKREEWYYKLVNNVWAKISVTALSVAVLIAVVTLALDNRSKSNEIVGLADQIDRLEVVEDQNGEIIRCREAMTNNITRAQYDFQSRLGDIVKAISANDSTGVSANIELMDAANDRWSSALELRDQYDEDGKPLPCPINVSG